MEKYMDALFIKSREHGYYCRGYVGKRGAGKMEWKNKRKTIAGVGVICGLLVAGIWVAISRPTAYAQGAAELENHSEEANSDSSKSEMETVSGGNAQQTEATDREPAAMTGGIAAILTGQQEAVHLAESLGIEQIPETQAAQSEEAYTEDEYANLAIANVDNYVNVRSLPGTDGAIVGKIYDGAVAQILSTAGENGDWFQIISGSVEGYIKAEYFLYGEEAAAVLENYVTYYAEVQVERLNVRREPTTDAGRIGYIDMGERVEVLENLGEWLRIKYTENEDGYVSAEFVQIVEEFIYAISIEEEQEKLAAQQVLQERQQVSEQSAPEAITNITFPETSYGSNEELRKAIVDYAMQYQGGAYVHGGRSLSGGTDCSGFTCYIYADFGYSISRTPSGQYSSDGRSISYEEIQPGDVICYSSNGKSCTHVGLYIGGGQIIHAANSRKGVVVQNADYDTIIAIKNIID